MIVQTTGDDNEIKDLLSTSKRDERVCLALMDDIEGDRGEGIPSYIG